jgi:hypothetical protein
MGFAEEHVHWLEQHLSKRKGESRRKLKEGHGHAETLFLEKVWYPAFQTFDHLFPEYEVHDFKDGHRYLDFAYVKLPFHACFEIDGYGTHGRDLSRWQFSDQLTRQNHLILDGWKVLRFAYDDVAEKPCKCQQMLQQLFGRWLNSTVGMPALSPEEKELLLLAVRRQMPITLADASKQLMKAEKAARAVLRSLVAKQMLAPVGGTKRVHAYRLIAKYDEMLF